MGLFDWFKARRPDRQMPIDGRPVPDNSNVDPNRYAGTPLWGQIGPPLPLPTPEDDEFRDVPPLIRPQARASWQPLTADIGNPWFRVPTDQNLRLYEQLVETIPVINAALDRIVQLVGCPYVEADDETQAEISEWMDNVVVNRITTGFENWFACWLKDHLTYGRAHAELILPANRRDIYAIQELHSRTIDLRPVRDGYSLDIVQIMAMRGMWITLNKRLIVTATHDLRNDMPHGHGLLFGLPFIAEIFTSMMKNQKRLTERFGNPMYHITYIPPATEPDPTGQNSQRHLTAMASQWNQAMQTRANGETQDVFTAGQVKVEVVGAAGETLEFVAPLRSIVEQIVAKTGLPPWMLGLQWQRTETMSTVEAGLLTQMIKQIRSHVEPEISYMIKLRQLLAGKNPEFKIMWESPTLIDALEDAKADLMQAKADAQTIINLEDKWRLGVVDEYDVARTLRPELKEKTPEEIDQLLPKLLHEPPEPQPPMPGFAGDLQADELQTGGMKMLALNGNGRHR